VLFRSIKKIRTNGGTQGRDVVIREIVIDYTEKIKEGFHFPPVDAFDDGQDIWLADGFHRYDAHVRAKLATIWCRLHKGTKRDAVLFSCGANTNHGLRRSNNDKIRSVMRILNDDEWCRWTNGRIAKHCGVSESFVASQRPRSIQADATGPIRLTIRGGVERLIDTSPRPKPVREPDTIVEAPSFTPPVARTAGNPLREFLASLRADDVPHRTNVKTDVGMAQVVTDDAVYHVAAGFNVASFLEAFGSVTFLRWALGVKRAVIVGPISDELAPYVEAARKNGVGVKPLG
jgi:hypothetical protein